MIQLTDNIWAVEVPDDAKNFRVDKYGQIPYLDYDHSIEDGRRLKALSGVVELPPGNWTFLFTTKGATEEQARKVVGDICEWHQFPIDLLNDKLRSKGCNTDKNYALIQKLNKYE